MSKKNKISGLEALKTVNSSDFSVVGKVAHSHISTKPLKKKGSGKKEYKAIRMDAELHNAFHAYCIGKKISMAKFCESMVAKKMYSDGAISKELMDRFRKK